MKKNAPYVLIILLIVVQIISYQKIYHLERQIEEASNHLWQFQDSVDRKINAIYMNVDEKLKEQASYIENIEIVIGKPNPQDLTAPITYTVIPKEVSVYTELSLDFNGEILEMERDGTSFSLTMIADIFGEDIYPSIIICEDDITKTEKNAQLAFNSLKSEIFPHSYIRLLGSSVSHSQVYERTGTLSWDVKQPRVSSEFIKFTEARFVIQVDDVIVTDQSIDINALDGYEVDEEIALLDGQTCVMTIIIKDSLNLAHHFTIDHYIQGNQSQREPFFDNEMIYSQEGTLLWHQKY